MKIDERQIIFALASLLIIVLMASVSCVVVEPSSPVTMTEPVFNGGGNNGTINSVISANTAFNMVQTNQDNPDFVILDVRTTEEFSSEHIAGALNIDIYSPGFKENINELDRNNIYLVYCRTARRSAEAAKRMKEMGFREVYDLSGGISQWIDDGYPVIK